MLVIDVTLNYLKFMVTFYMTQPMKGKLDFRWLNSVRLTKISYRDNIKSRVRMALFIYFVFRVVCFGFI